MFVDFCQSRFTIEQWRLVSKYPNREVLIGGSLMVFVIVCSDSVDIVFSGGSRISQTEGVNPIRLNQPIIWASFQKNCMKMNKI